MRTMRAMVVGTIFFWAAPSFAGGGAPGAPPAPPAAAPVAEAIRTTALPRTGIVVDTPRDAFVVGIAADGTILTGGHEGGLPELRLALRELARDPKRSAPDGSSKVDVVLRANASVPWQVAQWVMQTCAEEKLSRLYFAVNPEGDGAEGVIDTFLPQDAGIRAEPAPSAAMPELKVALFADREVTDRGAIYATLRQIVDGAGPVGVEIGTPPPNVPRTGHIVQLVDLARRAGAKSITFTGSSFPVPARRDKDGSGHAGALSVLRAWVAERSRTLESGVKVKVGKAFVEGRPDGTPMPLPPPPPRSAGVVGSGTAPGEMGEDTEEVHAKPVGKDPAPLPEDAERPEDGTLPPPMSAGASAAPSAFARRFTRLGTKDAAADGRINDAVEAGLRWLAAHQAADGSFMAEGFPTWCDGRSGQAPTVDGRGKPSYDVGTTGLALLAFLGAGYTNRSEGPFGRVVGTGLRWLKNVQDAEGCFGERRSAHYIYGHGIAALAMVEAYAMTGAPIYKNHAQKALDFVAITRNPYFAWRYGMKPGDNDTSVTAWMFDVLDAARRTNAADVAAGKPASLSIDDEAFDGVKAWLDKMTDPEWGRVGYQQRGTGVARPTELVDRFPSDKVEGLTGFGVFARIALGEDPEKSDLVQKGLRLVAARPPIWNEADGSIDLYSWRLCAIAMASVDGEASAAWRKALLTALLGHQRTNGDFCAGKGSWDPIDPWSPDGGRIYSTSMALLALLAPYSWEPPAAKPK